MEGGAGPDPGPPGERLMPKADAKNKAIPMPVLEADEYWVIRTDLVAYLLTDQSMYGHHEPFPIVKAVRMPRRLHPTRAITAFIFKRDAKLLKAMKRFYEPGDQHSRWVENLFKNHRLVRDRKAKVERG